MSEIDEIRERHSLVRISSITTIQAQEDVDTLLAHIDRLERISELCLDRGNIIAELKAENARLREALAACEGNLRLVHRAAGSVPKDAPMPTHSTFAAWKLAAELVAPEQITDRRHPGREEESTAGDSSPEP